MYAKRTGGSRNPKATMSYLGTDSMGSDSVAHNNPGKRRYLEAKKLFHDTGNPYTYRSWREARQMALNAVYMHRDLRTISNMRSHTNMGLAREIQAITNGDGRKVKSYEFILSPDPKLDKLDPHDKHDVDKLSRYAELFQHVCFDGRFVKSGRYRDRHGKYEYRYRYQSPKTNQSRFYHIIDVQPDSTHLGHLHCHFVEVSHDRLASGNPGMSSEYGSIEHIKRSVQRTTEVWNARHPHDTFSGIVHRKGREPNQTVEPIISGLNHISKDIHVKSLKAFRSTLANKYHIKAVRLRKTKTRTNGGWKFRFEHGPFVKASHIQKFNGLAPVLSSGALSKTIPKMLSKHRKQYAKLRHQTRAERAQHTAEAEHQQAIRNEQREERLRKQHEAASHSISISPEISTWGQYLANTDLPFQFGRNGTITNPYDKWVRSSPRRLARYYDTKADPGHEVAVMMPHLSSNPVRKSVPKVSECYQSQCYPTYHFKDAKTGRQEFHILDGELRYTDDDKGWFSRVFGALVSDFHMFGDKLGSRLVHSSIRKNWKRLTSSIKGYIKGRRQRQLPFRDKLYDLSRKSVRNYNGIMTLYFTKNSKSSYQLGLKHIKSFGDYKHDFFKLLGNEKARKELYAFSKRYDIPSWLDNHKLKDSDEYSKKMKARKRKQEHTKIRNEYGKTAHIYYLSKYINYLGITSSKKATLQDITTTQKRMAEIKRKYPHIVENFDLDKYIKKHDKHYQGFKDLQHRAEDKSAARNRQRIQDDFKRILYNSNRTYRPRPNRGPHYQGPTMG